VLTHLVRPHIPSQLARCHDLASPTDRCGDTRGGDRHETKGRSKKLREDGEARWWRRTRRNELRLGATKNVRSEAASAANGGGALAHLTWTAGGSRSRVREKKAVKLGPFQLLASSPLTSSSQRTFKLKHLRLVAGSNGKVCAISSLVSHFNTIVMAAMSYDISYPLNPKPYPLF
jgi:hypothetical protein